MRRTHRPTFPVFFENGLPKASSCFNLLLLFHNAVYFCRQPPKLNETDCRVMVKSIVFWEYSLYDEKLATYTKDDAFDHHAAIGFIELWGLPTKVNSIVKKKEQIEA